MFGRDKAASRAAAAAKTAQKAAKKAAKKTAKRTNSLLQDTESTVGQVSKRARKEMAKASKVGRKEMARTAMAGRIAAAETAKASRDAADAAKKANRQAAGVAKKAAVRSAKANGKVAKANREVAKAEGKLVLADQKAVTAATKSATRVAKAEAKAAKVRAKQPTGLIGQLTNPKTATRAMAAAKIVGPAVAPYALQAATSARGYLDERRAQKLGVSADEVAAYRGPTGPAGARIASLRSGVEEVRRRRVSDQQVGAFADTAKARLADLEIATHTAAAMPPARRRSTLVAIGQELNRIEADLMTYLVGSR